MWWGTDGCEEWSCGYWEGLVCSSGIQTGQCVWVLYCAMFGVQHWDTDRTVRVSAVLCNVSFTQYISVYRYIRYNLVLLSVFFSLKFWVSHLINQDNATAFCTITKYLLFCKTFKLTPTKRAHWSTNQLMSQCCPAIPHTDITFFSVQL
jgi:hypothetical protein